MKRVLVSGGTGFVGSFVCEELLKHGWTVRALIRNSARRGWLEPLPLEFSTGTIEDSAALESAVQDCNVVVHCAGLTKAMHSADLFKINGDATAAFVKTARESGVRRFIYCSSQAAAGPSTDHPRTESDTPAPISEYGRSKLAGEKAVIEHSGNMEWLIVRPPAVFGPHDEQFVPLFRAIARFGLYPVWGNGDQQYSIVYVRDLARVLAALTEATRGINEIYFAGSPTPWTWAEFSTIAADLVHKKARSLRVPLAAIRTLAPFNEWLARLQGKPALLSREKLHEILAAGWVCSSEKLYRTFGLSCDFDMRTAIAETLNDYRLRDKL